MSDEAQVIRGLLEQAIQRVSHLEQLILGLATLGFLGWGFLHASDRRESTRRAPGQHGAADRGRMLFAIIFSGSISSAFSGLFVGRMAVNGTLLTLEKRLHDLLSLRFDSLLYWPYFAQTTQFESSAVYYCAALFLPLMSLSSLVYVLIDGRRRGFNLFAKSTIRAGLRSGKIQLGLLWVLSATATIGMAFVSVVYIHKLVVWAYEELPKIQSH
jgi:hypothetical protein